MLFNSFGFIIFLIFIYALYWFILGKNLNAQNLLLLTGSYYFYSCWDWRFLFLLILSTVIDFSFGIFIYQSNKYKKLLLWLSILNNLGILVFFKYYNFFAIEAHSALSLIGIHFDAWLLKVILPIGISFYTFHGMSYVFDIYNKKVVPTRNFIQYAVFVCFFPLLVSGPIERATHLLPQVKEKRIFSYRQSIEGLRLILWGYFLKVVIADNLANLVNDIFKNYKMLPGSTLIVGIIYFSFQIYGDFCGYTNIAIGVAKLFGFELLSNFKYPYFSRNIGEFWRRWHISLSSWFRDYLYIPMGGSRVNKFKAIRNTFVIFVVSGFWHGASMNFVVWGAIHAVLFIPLLVVNRNKAYATDVVAAASSLPSIKETFQMILTFCLVTFAWIFFRSPNLPFAIDYIRHFSNGMKPLTTHRFGLFLIAFLLLVDWNQRRSERDVLNFSNKILRRSIYFLLTLSILFYSNANQVPFIYFQF